MRRWKINFYMTFRLRALPYKFVTKVDRAEYPVQHNLQIVARGRVTVQVQAPGVLQYAAQLHKATSHHHKVGHHVVVAQKLPQRRQNIGNGAALRIPQQLDELPLRLLAPVPRILKGRDLGARPAVLRRSEERVVVPVGIKGRIKVDQIDAGVGKGTENFQTVTVMEGAVHHAPS